MIDDQYHGIDHHKPPKIFPHGVDMQITGAVAG
jgi:hypothetical protein